MIVGWSIQESEQAGHSAGWIKRFCIKPGIEGNQLALHSDKGSPMKGAPMLATLYELGMATSFSRPRVINDNTRPRCPPQPRAKGHSRSTSCQSHRTTLQLP